MSNLAGSSSGVHAASSGSSALVRKAVYRDGKASVEHHLSIHIMDILTIFSGTDKSLELIHTLEGIKYIMDRRISGGKQPNIDQDVTNRLQTLLLTCMKTKTRQGLKKVLTPEGDLAFKLFADFLENVEEFKTAVIARNAGQLKHHLEIHRRIDEDTTPANREQAVRMLTLFMALPKYADWKVLVNSPAHEEVEKLLADYTPTASATGDGGVLPGGSWYDVDGQAVCDTLQTNPETGLSSNVLGDRVEKYGYNKLPAPPAPSVLKMLWGQVTDFMVLILLAAAVVSLGMQDYKAAVVLVLVVILNVLIGFVQEVKAEKALASLMSLSVPQATVIRDGKQSIVPSAELVPGDIVVLDEGVAIPADLRLLETAQLYVIESILTGESVPSEKKTAPLTGQKGRVPLGDRKNMAFMATVVSRGRGKGVVVSTGESTEVGKISGALASVAAGSKKTPLQLKLGRLGKWLVLISVLLCALVIVIGVVRKRDALEMVRIGISLAVSVIPEGLVAVVTITMALGVQRMSQKNAIVRKLPSVETLGSVTTVCSDKTGTLTEGKMKAERMWVDGVLYGFSGSGNNPEVGNLMVMMTASTSNADKNSKEYPQLTRDIASLPKRAVHGLAVCALCNNASVVKEDDDTWAPVGDPTEVALVVASHKGSVAKDYWTNVVGMRMITEFAFDSDRKRMSVIYDLSKDAKEMLNMPAEANSCVFAKGATEAILKQCSHFTNFATEEGSLIIEQLNDPVKERIENECASMASLGLRVIALAMRPLFEDAAQTIKGSNDANLSEKDLVFVGIIGLIDPPRQGVKEAVATCHNAGIRVCMITGDHVATATAIAKQLGILDVTRPIEGMVLRSDELDVYTEEDLSTLDPFPTVFARVSPDNKLKIVRALRSRGEVAAMTGDGVNDAPAIKQADVGIAMGQAGTEITKQSADIILADDNFATIVVAVEEGRRIYDNISKFILYLLSCNSAEIIIMLLSVAIGLEVPFSAIMILWANIVVDVPPSLSIGLEPVERGAMNRTPRDPKKGVFSKATAAILITQGVSMSMIALGSYMLALDHEGYELRHARTLTFNLLCFTQLAHSFFIKSMHDSIFVTGIGGNRWLLYAFLASAACLVAGVYIPGLNTLLELVPLGWLDWCKTLAAIAIHLMFMEIQKLVLKLIGRYKKQFKPIEVEMANKV